MLCLFESCVSNRQTSKKNHAEGVRFISFPTTDYASEQMRRLAKKRLYWWCRICGIDFTTTLINQFHICSRHFIKANCAPLWDVYNPDWLPSLFIPPKARNPVDTSTLESCNEFVCQETLNEESIANPLLDQRPDHSALRTVLIDDIIAYPIGRTYFLLDDESVHSNPASYDVRRMPRELKKCLSKTSPIGSMMMEPNAPICPEQMFATGNTVTQLDLSIPPRWETEKTITALQHSILELINLLD
uniref:THAP-type domain-containing protein n=1 Tax=Anopheles epiroticus TaxID=199890 RepID=A0A182PCP4_9DIPT